MGTPLAILVGAMVATLLLVGPFHRLAATYVGCYALGCLLRLTGLSEASTSLAWHLAAFCLAVTFPMLRGTACLMLVAIFAPLLMIDVLRLAGHVEPYEAWWLVYWMVCAQLALLVAGANWRQARALLSGGFRAYWAARPREFLRVGAV